MKTMKHCQRHGPESHPYCVECAKDDYAKEPANTGSDAPTCSPIESAWEAYHGPITDGEPYLPAMPPSFIRGFVDGYEHGKSQSQSILSELCDAVQERLRDDPTPESRMRCWNAWNAASEFLENTKDIPRNASESSDCSNIV